MWKMRILRRLLKIANYVMACLKTNSTTMNAFLCFSVIGTLASMVLFTLRITSVISFNEPLQVQTSGDEYTNLFYIWKATQGLPVYNDRFVVPFTATVYNWLFHESYAAFINGVSNVFTLSDAWQPTLGRILTLIAMSASAIASYFAFSRVSDAQSLPEKFLCLSFAVYLMFGPLIGFWSMTVRADLGGLFFEILSTLIFISLYTRQRLLAVLGLIVCVYLAWSFKQSNVFAAGGAGLFLVVRRDWKTFLLLITVLPTAWGITFLVGEKMWLHSILMQDYPLLYSFERLVRNMVNFAIKMGPILLFLLGLLVFALRTKKIIPAFWQSNAFMYALCTSVCAVALAIPASAQIGASENYYFSLSYFLGLIIFSSIPILKSFDGGIRLPVMGACIGWITLSIAVLLVVFGYTGVTNLRHLHIKNMALKECADVLPRPLYVTSNYLGLPWMTRDNPHFVLSYTYPLERKLGRKFENGGIGGMISGKKFAAVVSISETDSIDGASLDDYTRIEISQCSGSFVYRRNPGNS